MQAADKMGEAGTLILKSGTGDISVERATGHAEVTTGAFRLRIFDGDHFYLQDARPDLTPRASQGRQPSGIH